MQCYQNKTLCRDKNFKIIKLSCKFWITSILCFIGLDAKFIICQKTTYFTELFIGQNRNAYMLSSFQKLKKNLHLVIKLHLRTVY